MGQRRSIQRLGLWMTAVIKVIWQVYLVLLIWLSLWLRYLRKSGG